ncbi:MAG: DUF6320 domain-containing protein [Lachnospiraceae bacterium]
MFNAKRAYWRKLDNTAKIFPATSSKKDTRVFRFYCELREQVQEDMLQEALNQTIKKYPVFLSVMRKGLFWHYLERSKLRPVVKAECKEPCSNIYIRDKKILLFEVTYYQNRINFEVYHALTDGTGAMEFLRELVKNYLLLAHCETKLPNIPLTDETITIQDQEADSFTKYYSKDTPRWNKKKIRAFQIKKLKKEYGEMQITEETISVEQTLGKAREYGVSITVLLTTVLLYAIHEEMTKFQEKKPVVLMVPVNLRKFFPSESMLNFFGWIEPGYQFGTADPSFQAVLTHVKEFFQEELTGKQIAAHMNDLVALERHPILKFAPLDLKNVCMNAGAKLSAREVTAIFSNMGVVSMPDPYASYIERFGVYTSTPKVELCMCSFEDKISLGFTSRFDSLNIQRNFFRVLKEIGIDFEIKEPSYPPEREESYPGLSFFRTFSFLCIVAAVVAAIINVSVTPDRYWGVIIAAAILTMWSSLAVGFYKRHNLLKNAMWQLILVSIVSVLWDVGTGWNLWSVNYVVPGVSVTIMISMIIITKIQSLTAREYMIYYIMAAGYGMLIPFLLLFTGVATIRFPSVICIGFSFLFFIALAMFRHQELKEELNKKFHV